MAAGDIVKTHAFSVEQVDIDTDEDIATGEIIVDKAGAGFEQADLNDKGPFMVALETRVYATDTAAGTAHTMKALFSGIVKVKKATGAISKGRFVVVSATSGAVLQIDETQLSQLYDVVGIANEDAASGDATIAVRLRC